MNAPAIVRALTVDDLVAYKALRDTTLAAHAEAFSSDAETESRRAPESYLSRVAAPHDQGGHFTLTAWRGDTLAGALSCERDMRIKLRHIGHLTAMMVRADARRLGVGRTLLDAGIEEARRGVGLELLTLSVTSTNVAAIQLYERAGFVRYGTLPHAIKLGDSYHAKDLMVLSL